MDEGSRGFVVSLVDRPPRLRRPMIRYHGGKHILAPWIFSHLSPHRVYVEAFGGAASVLMRKSRSEVEVLSDIDLRLVSLYRTISDRQKSIDLAWKLWLTKYRPETLDRIRRCPETNDELELAAEIVIRGGLGRSISDGAGFRGNVARSDGTSASSDWYRYRKAIPDFRRRLQGVVIRQGNALDVMSEFDGPNTLHYVDPPYHPTQRGRHGYRHDLEAADNVRLLDFLRGLRGMVVLSGYSVPEYDDGLFGWMRVDRISPNNDRRKRVESLWLNPAAVEASRSTSVRQMSITYT